MVVLVSRCSLYREIATGDIYRQTDTHAQSDYRRRGGLCTGWFRLFSDRFVIALDLLVLVSFVGGRGDIGARVAVSSRERFIGIVGVLLHHR